MTRNKVKVENIERLKDENRGSLQKQLSYEKKEIEDLEWEHSCDQLKHEYLLEKLNDENFELKAEYYMHKVNDVLGKEIEENFNFSNEKK